LDPNTGREQQVIPVSQPINFMAISSDGQTLATSHEDKTVKLWQRATGKAIATLPRTFERSPDLSFSPDGRTLVTWFRDLLSVEFWDVASQTLRARLRGGPISSLSFSGDGKILALGGVDGSLRFWDMNLKREELVIPAHQPEAWAVAFSPDNKILATAGDDDTVKLWDSATLARRRVFRGHSATVLDVAFSPDGRLLASSSYDKKVKLWDLATG